MIRFIEKKDAEACATLLKEFYATDAVCHDIPNENIERTIELALADSPYVKIIISESDGHYEGFCTLSFTYSSEAGGIVTLIEEIYVRDDFKGKGIGTKIFEFVRSEFDHKTKRYRLEVVSENVGAIKLYERLGFEELPYMQMIIDL